MRAGITVEAFWQMTPREANMAVRAENWRWERDERLAAWMAHTMAGLQRSKRMPSLKKVFASLKPRKKPGRKELARRRREHEELTRRMG